MGRNLDRGFEDREERQRGDDSRKRSEADKVTNRTKKDLYDNFNR
jgi:hypothetical protein